MLVSLAHYPHKPACDAIEAALIPAKRWPAWSRLARTLSVRTFNVGGGRPCFMIVA